MAVGNWPSVSRSSSTVTVSSPITLARNDTDAVSVTGSRPAIDGVTTAVATVAVAALGVAVNVHTTLPLAGTVREVQVRVTAVPSSSDWAIVKEPRWRCCW